MRGFSLAGLGAMSGIGQSGVRVKVTSHFVDNSEEWLKAVRKQQEVIIMDFVKDVIIIAKSIVHVDTGTLRRSIKADRPGDWQDRTEAARSRDLGHPIPKPAWEGKIATLYVGATTFYAIYVEFKYPYLEPAMRMAEKGFKDIVTRHILNG